MRRRGIILMLLFICSILFGFIKPEKNIWNLEWCVHQALLANKDFLIAQESIKKAKAKERAAFAGLLPSLSFDLNYTRLDSGSSIPMMPTPITLSYPHNTSLGLTFGYAVPFIPYFSDGAWGMARQAYRIAKENLRMVNEQLEKIRIGVRSIVGKRFYGVLLSQRVKAVTAANQRRLRAYEAVAKRNYAAGRVSRYELLRTQVQLANNTPQLLQAENSLRLAKVSLLQSMGLGLDTSFSLKGRLTAALVRITEKQALQIAFANRYELKELARAKTIQQYTLALQKATRRPMLTLFGNIKWAQAGESFLSGDFKNSWSAGMQLSIPISEIFPWSKTKYNVKAAESDNRILALNTDKVRDMIKLQLRQIVLRLEEYKRTIDAQKIAIGLSTRGLAIARVRYANGQMGNVELMDAELDFQQAQVNIFRAWFQYISARYDLLTAIGVEKLK